MKHATTFLCKILWVSVQRTLCLPKKKRIWELTKFFSSNGISQSTSESKKSLDNSQTNLFFSKTTDFGYHSKCDYVQVEINSCNGDAAVLTFSVMFLLGLSRTKPQESPHLLSVCSGSGLGWGSVSLGFSLYSSTNAPICNTLVWHQLAQAEEKGRCKVHSGLEKHQSFFLPG